MSQAALACILGADPWTMVNWEKGRTRPPPSYRPIVQTLVENGYTVGTLNTRVDRGR